MSAARPITRRYLEILRADLERVLLPELVHPRTQTLAGMMVQLLGHLAAREAATDAMQARAAAQFELLERTRALVGGAQARSPAELANALLCTADAELSDAILHALIDVEERFDASLVHGAGAGRDAAYALSGGRGADASDTDGATPAPVERLTACLRRHLPQHAQVRCLSIDLVPGGFSKDTMLVATDGAEGFEQLVVRMDQRFSALGYTVVDEYPLLATLTDAGLPVPQPVLCETDAAVLGAPFIAMQRVDGSADMTRWMGRPEIARGIAAQLAQFLAQLHALDVRTLPVAGAQRSGDEIATALIDELQNVWNTRQLEPHPLMEHVFAWLRRHAPTAVARPALIHADAGFHNLLVDGDRVTAVLDWEFAHVGDPAEDLSYCRPFVEKLMPFTEFLSAYQAAGGQHYAPEHGRFYRVLSMLRVAIGCYALVHGVEDPASGIDAKGAFVGSMYARRFLIDAARQIVAEE